MADESGAPAVPAEDLRVELERLRLLHSISQEFNSSLDFDELLPKVFDTVVTAVGAAGGSLWIAEGDVLRCKLALGAASQKLIGTTMPDRKSTRLNSSHLVISYAVFCLKKKKKNLEKQLASYILQTAHSLRRQTLVSNKDHQLIRDTPLISRRNSRTRVPTCEIRQNASE